MARLLISAALFLATNGVARAEDLGQRRDGPVSDTTASLAAEADLDALALQGVANTLHLVTEPALRGYLYGIGALEPPEPPPLPGPPIFGALAQARCIIGKESGGLDIPNRSGSGATGPGQYFPGTWAGHVALYRAYSGYSGPLSLHSLRDVEAVMSYVLTLRGQRAHWVVGGCTM